MSADDIVNLAHDEYIENGVQRLRENLCEILSRQDRIELNELTLLGMDKISAYLSLLCLTADSDYDLEQDETSLSQPNIKIVNDFIQSFARGEAKIQAPVYLEQVTQAVNSLSEITKNQEAQITAMGTSALEVFEDGAAVSVETLIEKGIVKNPKDGVKILGNGELTKKLTVKANAFSASAKEKIEALGGTAEVI